MADGAGEDDEPATWQELREWAAEARLEAAFYDEMAAWLQRRDLGPLARGGRKRHRLRRGAKAA